MRSSGFRISQLRFSGGRRAVGFAIVRYVPRLNETSTWPLIARRTPTAWVSQFGELKGVSHRRPTKRLELSPYTVAKAVTSRRQRGNPLHKTSNPNISAGLDLKYAVTPALSLTATVNPDFGQVEADPAVVNLGAFETFFEERRPFFIEGSGTYRWNCNDDCILFYSRRIGRQPRGFPSLGDGEYPDRAGQTTILGAAQADRAGRQVFGRCAGGGHAGRDCADVAFGSARRSEVVEPRSFYSVSRARREFADQSSLGFILTTHQPQAERHGVISFLTGGDRRCGLRLAHRTPLQPERLLGGQQRQRQRGDRAAAAQ